MTRTALQVTQDLVCTRLDLDAPLGSLQTLQQAVGGRIEPVRLPFEDFEMYVNEEFLYTEGVTANLVASAFARQPILGNVIFTGLVDDEGETTGMTEEQALRVAAVVEKARLFLTLLED